MLVAAAAAAVVVLVVVVAADSTSSSSSSCSLRMLERCRFHDFMPQFTVICSVPGRPQPQPQVLLFEVVLNCTQPCFSRATARSSPLLRRIVDASIVGPRVVTGPYLNPNGRCGRRAPQTPGHDRLGDRRLSGTNANFLVGDMRTCAVKGTCRMCRKHH